MSQSLFRTALGRFVILLLMSLCVVLPSVASSAPDLNVRWFGTYSTESSIRIPAPESPTGMKLKSRGVKPTKMTKLVIAELGTSFGVGYAWLETRNEESNALRHVWRYPQGGLTNPASGRKFETSQTDSKCNRDLDCFIGYRFSEPWEQVAGTWTAEVWRGETLLLSQEFQVVLPATTVESQTNALPLKSPCGDIELPFVGVGLELTAEADGFIRVVSLLVGAPSEKSGLMVNDSIIAIDGNATNSLSLQEVVCALRGRAGSTVQLDVRRNSHREILQFLITRRAIVVTKPSRPVALPISEEQKPKDVQEHAALSLGTSALVGRWIGQNSKSGPEWFQFSQNGDVDFSMNGKSYKDSVIRDTGTLTFRVDAGVSPWSLDIIAVRVDGMSLKLPCIVEFSGTESLMLQCSFSGPRPKTFDGSSVDRFIRLSREN